MRITAGSAKNRRLISPENDSVRPASDKVRQAVFNILQSYGLPVDAVVLDLFCGTGAYGLESLSRGAKSCLFVDIDTSYAAENINALGFETKSETLRQNATTLRAVNQQKTTPQPANLIFLDPPYHKNLLTPTLTTLISGHWLAHGAILICESETGQTLDHSALATKDTRTYGNVQLIFLEYVG